MATVRMTPGFEQKLAAAVAARVERLAAQVAQVAEAGVGGQGGAPQMRRWETIIDGRTHAEHAEMQGQRRPEGVRFAMRSDPWDMQHRGLGPFTYLLEPRDESSGAVVAITNCRCEAVPDTDGRFRVGHTPATYDGRTVTATAYARGDGAVEAEFGVTYPGGQRSEGRHFMRRAAVVVASQGR